MTWLAIVMAALALPSAADAAKRARPDAVPAAVEQFAPHRIQIFNDYVTPARIYMSERAAVHFVVLGVSAPPLNDDDASGVPDYVERVGDAADTAIDYYDRRGFASILRDAGGPDGRPDLYISRFAAGYFGVAFPAAEAMGGAFLAVSNALDPSPTQSLGSLYGTVAHELFHLVQFSYFKPTVDPPLAPWVLEGMAAAMETRVQPELDDIVSSLQLRHWLAAPRQAVTAQSYGAQLLWRYLDERHPRLLPAYLEQLARPGVRAAVALRETYSRVAPGRFAREFGAFAASVAERYGDRLQLPVLWRGAARTASVAPLAIHFQRLPRSTQSVTVRFTRGRAEATLIYEVASERPGDPPARHRLPGRVAGRQLRFEIPAWLRALGRFERATLVVANGGRGRVAYRASAA